MKIPGRIAGSGLRAEIGDTRGLADRGVPGVRAGGCEGEEPTPG